MKEAARVFGGEHGIEVVVTSGPTPEWAAAMKGDGDLVFSGSEAMMGDFIATFGAILKSDTVRLLYLRPAGILVRPGNPKKIRGFADLLAPGVRIAVVDGAGQQGMWEDIAGRDGSIVTLRGFRANIVRFAPNTAEALKSWQSDASIDAWLTFPIWSVAHPGVADVVPSIVTASCSATPASFSPRAVRATRWPRHSSTSWRDSGAKRSFASSDGAVLTVDDGCLDAHYVIRDKHQCRRRGAACRESLRNGAL